MGTPMYVNLTYHQYKTFEDQFKKGIDPLESTHTSMDERYYHKAVRFALGDLEFEVTGPAVQAPRMVCPLCNQPSPNGEVHQECADREAASDAWASEQEGKQEAARTQEHDNR